MSLHLPLVFACAMAGVICMRLARQGRALGVVLVDYRPFMTYFFSLLGSDGAWTDQAYYSYQDVPELG